MGDSGELRCWEAEGMGLLRQQSLNITSVQPRGRAGVGEYEVRQARWDLRLQKLGRGTQSSGISPGQVRPPNKLKEVPMNKSPRGPWLRNPLKEGADGPSRSGSLLNIFKRASS